MYGHEDRQDLFNTLDEMTIAYISFMVGCSITLLFFSWLYYGDYHYRIVLNWLELKIAITGSLFSAIVCLLSVVLYCDLHDTANGIRSEIMYKCGLGLLCFIYSGFFLMLMIDWVTKSQYDVVGAEMGIRWSWWEYHAQRIINYVMVDTLFDIVIIRRLRIPKNGQMPRVGYLCVSKEFMTNEDVQLVLLRQKNRRRIALKKYLAGLKQTPNR